MTGAIFVVCPLCIYKNQHSLAWCLTYIIPTYRRLTEEDSCEFMGNMGCRLTLLHKGKETERHTHRETKKYTHHSADFPLFFGV